MLLTASPRGAIIASNMNPSPIMVLQMDDFVKQKTLG